MKVKFLVLFLFVVFYFFVRYPIYRVGWDGNDGNGTDVDIMVHQPKKPDYYLLGRFDGKPYYAWAYGHPAVVYGLYEAIGAVINRFFPWQRMSAGEIITVAKLIPSLLQLAVFLPLLWIILGASFGRGTRERRAIAVLGLVLVSVSPMAMYNTNELQPDSTLGVLTVGFFMLVLLLGALRHIKYKLILLLLFLTSSFVGLGKNEWSLMLIAASVVSAAYVFFRAFISHGTLSQSDKSELWAILVVVIGSVSGNIASYWFAPRSYLSGWSLLSSMVRGESALNISREGKMIWMNILRMPYTLTILALFGYLISQGVRNYRRFGTYVFFSIVYASLLFLSFSISTWGEASRYFAPSFMAMLSASVLVYILYDQFRDRRVWWLVGWLLALNILLFNYDGLIVGRSIFGRREIVSLLPNSGNCVPLVRVDDMYLSKGDFVHVHMGWEGGGQLAKTFGKVLCDKIY